LPDSDYIIEHLEPTLLNPDVVWQSTDNPQERLLAREVDLRSRTKHIVVIVVRQEVPVRIWMSPPSLHGGCREAIDE
jgi:hypothetical protein